MLCVVSLCFGAASASAQTSERITSYLVDLDLRQTGDLNVIETITYDFGGESKRGIFRTVPVKVRYDDTHDRLYRVTGVSVSATPKGGRKLSGNGDPATLTQTEKNDQAVIRIGDADTFLSGVWQYRISYSVSDTVEPISVEDIGKFDELAWNAIGPEWAVPMANVQVTLHAPDAAVNTKCYRGSVGSKGRCELTGSGTTQEPLRTTFATLSPGEAATIYLDLQAGTIPNAKPRLKERQTLSRAFRTTPLTAAATAAGALLVLGGLGGALSRQARDRRLALNAYLPANAEPDRENLVGFFEKVEGPVQFRVPEGMTPGLCGVLTDESADTLDVTATIVDLAVRDYLHIEELGKDNFRLTFHKPVDATLLPYERTLLAELISNSTDGERSVTLDELRRKFSESLAEVKKQMYVEVMARAWFRHKPETVRSTYYMLGLAGLVAGIAATFVLAKFAWGLMGLPIVLAGVLVLGFAKHMPSRTNEGRRQLELCVGFERFLDVADAEQLQFQERQMQFVAGLPYAMVFGLTQRWAQVLSVLQEQGFNLQPSWYVPLNPTAGFQFWYLGNAMSSFTNHSVSAISALPVPKPSTGGGFGGGGGGFSGGGGGGGGGGSW